MRYFSKPSTEPEIPESPTEKPTTPEIEEEEPAPPNIVITSVKLRKSVHPFVAEVHLNNTGDLPAHNLTLNLEIKFGYFGGAKLVLINNQGVLSIGLLKGNTTIGVVYPHSSTYKLVTLLMKVGDIWSDNPIAFIENPNDGYTFYIIQYNITKTYN